MVALGYIVQAGYTLLECAEGTDGGRSSSDSEQEKRDHASRKARVYAAIMNYISPFCKIYRDAKRDMQNDGPGLYKWLQVKGKLEYDEDTLNETRETHECHLRLLAPCKASRAPWPHRNLHPLQC